MNNNYNIYICNLLLDSLNLEWKLVVVDVNDIGYTHTLATLGPILFMY